MGGCAPSTLVCSRCQAHGHLAKDCKSKPFLRLCSLAEEREQRQLAAAQRRKEWEARKLENERKQKEYEEKKAAHEARIAASRQRRAASNKWECESSCTESTAVTSCATSQVDVKEVERLASTDKEVRKLAKKLQEISKLEGLRDLDKLQVAKVARKREVKVAHETALGLAMARIRNELGGKGTA